MQVCDEADAIIHDRAFVFKQVQKYLINHTNEACCSIVHAHTLLIS